ncbi:hypothetical protein BYT27DRAFT_7107897, partial [Phlegmacium glaucopus]
RACLYCNGGRRTFFCFRVNFLGHTISGDGFKADEKKAEKIENWPVPTSATDIKSSLGFVCYLNIFFSRN